MLWLIKCDRSFAYASYWLVGVNPEVSAKTHNFQFTADLGLLTLGFVMTKVAVISYLDQLTEVLFYRHSIDSLKAADEVKMAGVFMA